MIGSRFWSCVLRERMVSPNLRLMTEFTVSVFQRCPNSPSRRAVATKSALAFRSGSTSLPCRRIGGIMSSELSFGVKACIRQHQPSALLGFAMSAKTSTATFQGVQMSHIITRSIARLPGENVLAFCSNSIGAFDPVFVRSSTASLVIQTGLSR